ncbi:unnamed protein product [Diatraea saccharalis]|uniref:Uncharacterized protein n=1 Tax=Diatraea saccharalis TaxID=40085 RepID=A0A9N9R186_9NEOP|nr:unnamed protein product [Diatraea saccharalis]
MNNLNSTFNSQEGQAMSVGEMSGIQSSESPHLLEQVTPPNFVTQRNRMDSNDLRNDFKSFQETIMSTLERWFSKYDEKQTKLLNEVEEVKKSLDFVHKEYEKLNKISYMVFSSTNTHFQK